jgi:branched-chain amino acid transport system substrate-binding protein
VTGGDIHRLSEGRINEVDFEVVQSYTFKDASSPTALKVAREAMRVFGVPTPERIPSAVGLAHAYDLTHLLALAINRAGTTARPVVRDALENLGPHDGLVGHYARPFTPDRHEALEPGMLRIMRYGNDGALMPASQR